MPNHLLNRASPVASQPARNGICEFSVCEANLARYIVPYVSDLIYARQIKEKQGQLQAARCFAD